MANTYIPSYDYLMRGFYSSNRYARKTYNRTSFSWPELASADSDALRKISQNLSKLEYDNEKDSSNGEIIFNNAKAFVETYNNLIDSSNNCTSREMSRMTKKLKEYVKENKTSLEEIGISCTSSGKLNLKDSDLKASSMRKIKKLFSKDGDFTSTVANFGRKINRISKKAVIEDVQMKNLHQKENEAPQTNPAQTVNQMGPDGIDFLA